MNYFTQHFTAGSARLLSDEISAYLAANPTYIPVSVSVFPSGEFFGAILVYGV